VRALAAVRRLRFLQRPPFPRLPPLSPSAPPSKVHVWELRKGVVSMSLAGHTDTITGAARAQRGGGAASRDEVWR
jgi:hypothetical protein